jgi:hypothetical protein
MNLLKVLKAGFRLLFAQALGDFHQHIRRWKRDRR